MIQHFGISFIYLYIYYLEPASEYVVSIRAFNNMGEGQPRYGNVFTLEETGKPSVA
jgi:hypothetical protein